MSAEQFDGAFAGPLAQPAVDILPMATGRKGKQTEAEPEALAAPAQPGPVPEVPQPEAPAPVWAPPPAQSASPAQPTAADQAPAPVNPWTGAPATPLAPPVPSAEVLAGLPAPQPAAAVAVHVPLPLDAPVAQAAPAEPKKFFGMQVRRPKKNADAPVAEAQAADQTQPFDAVVAPVAAWPTDVGVPAVADAEPGAAAAGWAAPAAYAPIDLLSSGPATDAPPVEVAPAAEAVAPVEAAPPVEAVAPVEAAPPVEASVPTPVVVAEPATPAGPSSEVVALRALLEASEAQRLAAETRADQAVVYAQQTQARLQQLEADGQARIQAAETRARTAANDAQDWQIRHREAEATIAELAASVAGSEQRMTELRSERDDLLASLEDVTAPESHAPTL